MLSIDSPAGRCTAASIGISQKQPCPLNLGRQRPIVPSGRDRRTKTDEPAAFQIQPLVAPCTSGCSTRRTPATRAAARGRRRAGRLRNVTLAMWAPHADASGGTRTHWARVAEVARLWVHLNSGEFSYGARTNAGAIIGRRACKAVTIPAPLPLARLSYSVSALAGSK